METFSSQLLTFLLNSLWQIPFVTAIAWIVSRMLRNAPANYRHAMWVAALGASFLLPLLSVAQHSRIATEAAAYTLRAPETVPAALGGTGANPASSPLLSSLPRRSNLHLPRITANIWMAAYLLFLCFQISRLMLAWRRTLQIVRASERVITPPPLLASIWQRAERAFNVRGVELRSAPNLCGPVTAGIIRRRIIVPASFIQQASNELLTTAIGHEMAHVARRDFALNALCELIALPISWYPFCAFIKREIERTREMTCDESVTRRLIKPEAYARSIVNIAAEMTALRRPGYTLGAFDGNILEERIEHLLNRPTANLKRARLALAAGFSTFAICAVVASGLAISARAQSAALPEMKRGADAFNSGAFTDAVQHFRNAVALDPADTKAKLYLAKACQAAFANQPAANRAQADADPLMIEAARQYRDVLARNSINKSAILGLSAIAGPDDLRAVHDLVMKLILADPKDQDAYYTAAVLDWRIAWNQIQQAYSAAGLKPVELLPDAATRQALRDTVQPQIEEGLKMAQLALVQKPDWSDALAYLSLLLRSDAMIADTQAQYQDLLAKADANVRKALQAKRAEAASAANAITVDADGVPSLVDNRLAPPPPPPPPPPGDPRNNKDK